MCGTADAVEDVVRKQSKCAVGLLQAAADLDNTGIAGLSEVGAALRGLAFEIQVHNEEMTDALRVLRASLNRSKPGPH